MKGVLHQGKGKVFGSKGPIPFLRETVPPLKHAWTTSRPSAEKSTLMADGTSCMRACTYSMSQTTYPLLPNFGIHTQRH